MKNVENTATIIEGLEVVRDASMDAQNEILMTGIYEILNDIGIEDPDEIVCEIFDFVMEEDYTRVENLINDLKL